MIRLAILLLLTVVAGAAFALSVPVAPKEKRSHLMDVLEEAGRECRAMGPTACRTFIATPDKEPVR